LSGAAGAASFLESWEATGRVFAPYEYTQGDRVLASFSSETYPGDVNPLRDYGTEAAKAALEMLLLKGAGKYLEKTTGSLILVSGVKKEGEVADGIRGASNADQTILPAWYREDSSASAFFNKTGDLPEGYRRVLNTRTGNAEILAPDGQLYFDTGNGLKPKLGGNLAELAEAERRINGTKGTGDWAKLSGQLSEASKGKGNFGIGSGTREQAEGMGKAGVGDGYKVASDGKTLVSQDGLRQYRPPTYKPYQQGTQANFEQRFPGQETKKWQSNGHLDITD
jgi:hypothetical protein